MVRPTVVLDRIVAQPQAEDGVAIAANLERVVRVYRGNHSDSPIMPVIVVIEPTSACNVNCIMCPNSNMKSRSFMDLRLFKSIIDQGRFSAKAILLYFVGEPLLHKDIVAMVDYCKATTQARVTLSTNATLLDPVVGQQLIEAGLDEIVCSLDGNTPEVYHQIRRGADFGTVTRNIKGFLALKNGREKPRCVLQFVRMHLNEHEIQNFRETWSSQDGCDVSVTWLDTWAYQMPELALMSNHLSPNRYETRLPCADLWFKMVVNSRGEVVLCCHDWAGKHLLGDLNRQSVEETWNGERINELRRLHHERRHKDVAMCRSCFEWSKEEDEYVYFPEFVSLSRRRP